MTKSLVSPLPSVLGTWVLMSLSVIVLSPLQGKERNVRVSGLGVFEILPRSINVRVVSCSKVEPCRRVRMGIKAGAFHQRP